jgi:hypothetical protein
MLGKHYTSDLTSSALFWDKVLLSLPGWPWTCYPSCLSLQSSLNYRQVSLWLAWTFFLYACWFCALLSNRLSLNSPRPLLPDVERVVEAHLYLCPTVPAAQFTGIGLVGRAHGLCLALGFSMTGPGIGFQKQVLYNSFFFLLWDTFLTTLDSCLLQYIFLLY